MSDPLTNHPTLRVIVTRPVYGVCHMQVCAAKDATDEEILAVCNAENQSGTEHGWSTVCRTDSDVWGPTAPVVCADHPDRLHILVAC